MLGSSPSRIIQVDNYDRAVRLIASKKGVDLIGGKNEGGVNDEMNPVKQGSKELDYKGFPLPRPKARQQFLLLVVLAEQSVKSLALHRQQPWNVPHGSSAKLGVGNDRGVNQEIRDLRVGCGVGNLIPHHLQRVRSDPLERGNGGVVRANGTSVSRGQRCQGYVDATPHRAVPHEAAHIVSHNATAEPRGEGAVIFCNWIGRRHRRRCAGDGRGDRGGRPRGGPPRPPAFAVVMA